MLWNYHPDDIPGPDTEVTLDITGLTTGLPTHLLLQHYRIDEHHSNAYTMWKQMGSPQQPSSDQIRLLESAAQLQPLTSPEWLSPVQGRLQLTLHLPYQSVDLITLTGGPQ
jgi:xylan 1,4-beta-xylosidase